MKSRKKISSSRMLNLIISLIIFASCSLFAQDDFSKSEKAKINEMTDKLNKKIILSDEQKSEVQKILKEYFDGLQNKSGNAEETDKLRSAADKKIQTLFDSKQKMKFNIISDDWWALAKS